MARHDGASCDVNLHAIVLTVINTIPTPVQTQTKFRVKTKQPKKKFLFDPFPFIKSSGNVVVVPSLDRLSKQTLLAVNASSTLHR
jgi:hypothetical protein